MRLFLAALTLLAATTSVGAQWVDRKTPGIPRNADGTPNRSAAAPRGADGKPDFTGVWNSEAPASRPAAADMQPWVDDLVRQRQQEYFKARPAYQCLPSGPEAEKFGGWKRILQTPTTIAILSDDLTYRVVHMDGRQLEANPAPSWMGYSVGRWDGDTLVVDSNGFSDKTWASRYGVSHTEALQMTERYRRSDFGHLQVEVTFTDTRAFLKPWGVSVEMELATDTEMLEAVCERSSDEWAGGLSDASNRAVSVPPEVLAKYVGVYSGLYQGSRRTIEVTLSGRELIATLVSDVPLEGVIRTTGLGAAGARTLVPQSQTVFEGLGLGYQFVVDDNGVATAVVEIHVSGPYKYARVK